MASDRTAAAFPTPATDDPIVVQGLSMGYDGKAAIMSGVDFSVRRGEVLAIVGGSGCGKTTLLRHLIGLLEPRSGRILFHGRDLAGMDPRGREEHRRRMGVLFQTGALWSNLTLLENVALPLQEVAGLGVDESAGQARFKLSLVGLAGFEDFYPHQISGGMCKRAGLARAMALDPEFLFCDEPSAGLDPISSHRLDELILGMRDAFGTTVVMPSAGLKSAKTGSTARSTSPGAMR